MRNKPRNSRFTLSHVIDVGVVNLTLKGVLEKTANLPKNVAKPIHKISFDPTLMESF